MKKGFTLVELLAVIVILAVVLVIAVPAITKLIKDTKVNGITSTAKLIASKAEERVIENSALGIDETINCNELIKLDDNYSGCTVSIVDGKGFITLIGANKFEGLTCSGTKDEMSCTEGTTKYTIRRSLTASSSAWERLDDNEGLVANATKTGSAVTNNFDSIYPWSDIISYNYSDGAITAYYGDSNFKFDGSNGEVLTKIPEFYYKRYQEGGYEYISISPYSLYGYEKSSEFSVGRYISSYDGSKLHSRSGTMPEVSKNITTFRTLSQAVGTNFGQLDYRYFIIEMLYLVEYADYNSQTKLGKGQTSYRGKADDKALIAEDSTNRIVINTTGGNSFVVGQYINIGTAVGNSSKAKHRTITAITDYSDENEITGKAITFSGNPANIAVDNIISSAVQPQGDCDSLGMKSGTTNNDGRHGVIYRGIENPFGNAWQYVDGINVKDRVAYMNYNPSTYAVNVFTEDYSAVGYTNATASGYAKTIGYDSNHPLVAIPIVKGGAASTYMSDYYYQSTGNRIALVGGSMISSSYAGLFAWKLSVASTNSTYDTGSRLLKY